MKEAIKFATLWNTMTLEQKQNHLVRNTLPSGMAVCAMCLSAWHMYQSEDTGNSVIIGHGYGSDYDGCTTHHTICSPCARKFKLFTKVTECGWDITQELLTADKTETPKED